MVLSSRENPVEKVESRVRESGIAIKAVAHERLLQETSSACELSGC